MDYKWKHFGNKIKCQTTTTDNVVLYYSKYMYLYFQCDYFCKII